MNDPREIPISALTRDRLGELYERHIGPATSLARALTGDLHLAEDIAEEGFLRATGRFAHLRDAAAFEVYLRRTVVNLVRKHHRRLQVERRYLVRYSRQESEALPPATEDGQAWLDRLPYRQRAALVLRYYEDLSERTTAEILRCSPRAVNSLVSRALSTLRQVMDRLEA